MMRQLIHKYTLLLLAFFLAGNIGYGQESIFDGLKSDEKKADEYFEAGNFLNALDLYQQIEKKKNSKDEIILKLARTFFKLQEYELADSSYKNYLDLHATLPLEDYYVYAEVLAGVGDYDEAIQYYTLYKEKNPEQDQIVVHKIWRLQNLQYLYEDSIYYSIKPTDINTGGVEFGPRYYQDGLVFVGNREEVGGIKNVDAASSQTFQTVYFTRIKSDTLPGSISQSFEKPIKFATELEPKFHRGMVSFFPGQQKMVYSKNDEVKSNDKISVLQLYFAEIIDGRWKETGTFEYNSSEYSIRHPTLSTDGKELYFASDKSGGFGGNDIYKSIFTEYGWSVPENLGSVINTAGEELFPYHQGTSLYFASDGQNGLGGLDIFKVVYGTAKIENMGYPINTQYDDFGIVLNSEGTMGYISSNRLGRGIDDDIFEIEIDIQSYPLIIAGTVRVQSLILEDRIDLQILDSARLILIDSKSNRVINETVTNQWGGFQIKIPYSGEFLIKVLEERIGEKMVSLQIPKNIKSSTIHEIVIVPDPDQTNRINKTQSPMYLQNDLDKSEPIRPSDNLR